MKILCVLLLFGLSAKAQNINLNVIAKIESNFDTLAVNWSDGGSRGIYQIHPICLKEYNRMHNTQISLSNLFKKDINTKIATWMFTRRLPQLLNYYGYKVTTRNILIAYNAGIGFLINKQKIPETTVEYIRKYTEFSKK